MDIEQLRAFDRIVREGNFSRAALALDITQPTISARIQTLEQSVGGLLFVRGGRHIELTAIGESFLPYARRALDVLSEGVEAARLTQVGSHGRLTVGVLQSLAGGFLVPALDRFHTTHPYVEIFVRTGHGSQITEMVQDGTVKVGLIGWPFLSAELTTILRLRERLMLVVSPSHPLSKRKAVSIRDIEHAGKPFMLVRWGQSMAPVLAQIDTQIKPVVELPTETIRKLLLRGVGAAFLTRTLVADDLATGRLVEVEVNDLSPLFRESALVRSARSGELPPAVEDFVGIMQEEAGRLVID
ncbi:MAG: hypothetical protein GFH27_549303n162 [Chloroflexi bacterium AL-W]|nr:hypothetical protein [Chloroflexi bacterium AL-N1]NOK68047.1 hypothetical protein [Chloroflexi bacterium AL-N10]NOK73387.1 hypothetical protein [Chloroflexi bacterium AL-N5]NOK83301.1 hypothetical protein [Chloroflexi bacterium AL-W]NOK87718.1 hypothetical protein [Chloroflexi bacterium AL-N15]